MLRSLTTTLAYTIYPAMLALAYFCYFLLLETSGNLIISLVGGITLPAVLILFLELWRPLNAHWKPNFKDFIEDVLFYTLLVQVALPITIYAVASYLLNFLGFADGVVWSVWPATLPLWLQFLLFCVIAELFQYWWHRLCHTSVTFWPIHAIHHMPQKLYSTNTARFHFFDKGVEFIFTILIFRLLGAPLDLICYYYIFFAITGFIQHSNLDARLGWLDYIIASGETHRFHHDVNPQKSKINYANNLVVWDLAFGTFKRDFANPLRDVGMRGGNVPKDVWTETQYPWVQFFKTHQHHRILYSLNIKILNLFLPLKMRFTYKRSHKRLTESVSDPRRAQLELLKLLVSQNQNTHFGGDHKFSEIKTFDDYRKNVPLNNYEDLRPYIDEIINGKSHVLTNVDPYYFTKTSGTTGKSKYIPINTGVQESYLSAQYCLTYAVYQNNPNSFSGLIYTVTGGHTEEMINNRWPAGSMSGKLMSLMPRFLRGKYTLSEELAHITDYPKKYLYLAALALLSPDVTTYASPNPATLLKIFEVINRRKDELRTLLQIPNDGILKKYAFNVSRSLKVLNSSTSLTIKDVWPNLQTLALWTRGSCFYLIPQICESAGACVSIIELGYMSSEFYGTVTVDAKKNQQLPTLQDNFFEFIERSAYDGGERTTLLLDQLELGKEYYIIVTTKGGLYRYFINDIVVVDSFYQKTPTLKFVQKGKGVTNIVGEKLSEFQLVSFFEKLPVTTTFFICLADPVKQKYRLYIELEKHSAMSKKEISQKLEEHLFQMNIEYRDKILSQRLSAIEVVFLNSGTSELYKVHCIEKGQREAQFKFLYLQYTSDVGFNFDIHERASNEN